MTNKEEKFINLNRETIPTMTMFHFQYSLRPFICARGMDDDLYFIDLTEGVVYNWDELGYNDLYFYTKEDDEDFYGVAVIGDINY